MYLVHDVSPYTISLAGLRGFEPLNAGIKTLCLTAWR